MGKILIDEETVVSCKDMADLLGVSDRTVMRYQEKGILRKKKKNEYFLLDSIRSYTEYIQHGLGSSYGESGEVGGFEDDFPVHEIRKRTEIAKMNLLEMDVQERSNNLISVDLVKKDLTNSISIFKKKLSLISKKVAGEYSHDRKLALRLENLIEKQINEALDSLCELSK